ncbi:beta-galactosidase family protein [Paenibacillus sp. HB172176]|uniref:glycoside hydrolase family 35 protein n=1 Tax=Paenibacillus sp. HB172176 TaxID=2493690 RepID=UPI00143B103F|nr:beta-galactosidase family protein [Paenibacillus sp. HB172176]
MDNLSISGNRLMLGNDPVRIISGAVHYFRVVPEYWKDRLQKLKACGFNTVETYVPWNLHEPNEGQFVFEGIADIENFIRTAGELGLYVIVRPSPYICAEWEFGGLPAWLLADANMRLRCADERFLEKVDAYYEVLLPKFRSWLSTNGGPIIAMQIENEYGSYGNDKTYLNHIKQRMLEGGIDVLLFTSDGPTDFMLQGGMVDGVWATANFGARAKEGFEKLAEYQPGQPLMCMEYWNGWFDHWMEEHHTRETADVAQVFDDMLAAGGSVNFYMFHGGTNFGFYNGANHQLQYEPTITSYDYDAPLSECGDVTEKFYAVRDVLSRYQELGPLELPEPIAKRSYGTVALTETVSLFHSLPQLSSPVQRACPEPMERVGQNYGFIVYTTYISGPRQEAKLHVRDMHDRGMVYVDGGYRGVIERWNEGEGISFAVPAEGCTLTLLVENMGRVNYGPFLKDSKGITEGVLHGQQFLFDWTIYPLPLDDLSKLIFEKDETAPSGPAFFRGEFEVDEPADTFLNMKGWTKGVAYVNGFNLGRYWERGPQCALYIPAPLLNAGRNVLILFELHGCAAAAVELQDRPVLSIASQ